MFSVPISNHLSAFSIYRSPYSRMKVFFTPFMKSASFEFRVGIRVRVAGFCGSRAGDAEYLARMREGYDPAAMVASGGTLESFILHRSQGAGSYARFEGKLIGEIAAETGRPVSTSICASAAGLDQPPGFSPHTPQSTWNHQTKHNCYGARACCENSITTRLVCNRRYGTDFSTYTGSRCNSMKASALGYRVTATASH